MFSPSHYYPSHLTPLFHGALRPNPNPKSSSPLSILHFPNLPSLHRPLISNSLSQDSNDTPNAFSQTDAEIPLPVESNPSHRSVSRRQNANSLLILHSHSQTNKKKDQRILQQEEEEKEVELQRKEIVEEASLATRRIPRFPGSIDFPKPERLGRSADLDRIVGSDDRVLKKAVEVRRGVAAEILKAALRAGKLSINYSANLVSRLPEFIDRVVIGAAAMKGASEFSHASFNARAKSYIQNSDVVALVKWLKHNSLTYPQIGKIICICSGDLKQVRQKAEWLKTVYVKGRFIGVVLVKASSILERTLDELEEIVDFLVKNGVKRDWVGVVFSRCPQLLSLSMEDLVSRVNFYLDMSMNEKDFGTMVYDYPKVLGFFSLDDMNSKVQYLKEFGLSTEELGRLLAFKSQLMGCSIEERWRPLVKYLYYLGVRRDGMKRLLLVKPMIFCVDLETTIAPKVRFLQDIGIKEEAIGSVLVKFPPLLTYSLYKKIRPVVIFLLTKAGVTQRDIAKVIAFDPQLVGCSIVHKLEVNVKYFLSLGIRLKSLGEMVADFPMLLRYNMDVLRPKYRYLRRIMVRPLQDLIEFPRFVSYSLDDRIIPRHKILVANRINFKLRYMLAGSDEEFNRRVQAAIESRRRFESGETNLDLSDSEFTHVAPLAS